MRYRNSLVVRKKKFKHHIDYNAEIPFEKKAPKGVLPHPSFSYGSHDICIFTYVFPRRVL